MRIISSKGEFKLPVGFTTEITSFSQVFNDQGEQSIPVTLPGTHNNLFLLNFPERLDSYYKPLSTLPVDVVDDVFVRRARMEIHTANEQDGISCTLYFREASFYALIDDMTMQSITLDVINGVGATHEDKVQYLITMLKNEYLNQTSQMFSVFPVQTEHSVTREFSYKEINRIIDGSVPESPDYEDTIFSEKINLVLNGFETKFRYEPDNSPEKKIYLHKFQGEAPQVFIESGNAVSVSAGYGMTAFVDVFYFIQKMFVQLGYQFNDTDLRSVINGSDGKLSMLNNVADAIYDAKLDLNQLVPGMGLKEFLKKMAVYCSGVFYVDETNKIVRFFQYSDIFEQNIKADLTKYLSSPLKIESVEFVDVDLFNISDSDIVQKTGVDYIDVSLPAEVNYVMQSHFQIVSGDRYEAFLRQKFNLSLMSVNNIIHLNSELVKNSEIDTSKEKDSSKELILAGVRKGIYATGVDTYRYSLDGRRQEYTYNYYYYKGYSAIYRNSDNPIEFLRTLFEPFLYWNRNSNIPVTCEMHLPPEVIYNIDLSEQYLIDGQVFFFDQLKYNLPYDGLQKVNLRTYRKYEDKE